VLACHRHQMDRAFEAVECSALIAHGDSEHPALATAANIAGSHDSSPLLPTYMRQST
jgi:hypothetical protein